MAKLDDLIRQKQQRDEDWKAKKTVEREELSQLSDDAVMRVTSEPNAYLHYLDTQDQPAVQRRQCHAGDGAEPGHHLHQQLGELGAVGTRRKPGGDRPEDPCL